MDFPCFFFFSIFSFPDVYPLEYNPEQTLPFQNRLRFYWGPVCQALRMSVCWPVTSGYWGLHVGHGSVWDAPCAGLTCLPGLLKMCHRASLLSPEIFEGSEPLAMNSFWLLGSRSLPRSGWEGLCWPSWVPAPGEQRGHLLAAVGARPRGTERASAGCRGCPPPASDEHFPLS